MVVAKILSKDNLTTSNASYFLSFIVLTLPCIILLNQPDVGQTILLILSWSAVVFISGIKLIYIFSLFSLIIAIVVGLLLIFPNRFSYILQRIETFEKSLGCASFSAQALLASLCGRTIWSSGGFHEEARRSGQLLYRLWGTRLPSAT